MLVYSAITTKKNSWYGKQFHNGRLIERIKQTNNSKIRKKKVIINHINEIHSTDLVDMTQYSKINKGYKYILTNIDIFSKYAYAYPIKSRKIQDIKPCFEKIFKKTNPNIFGVIKNQLFSVKKCKSFSKTMTLKYIIPILI